jgi:hypothetical protein
VELVDKVVLEQRVHELTAAVGRDGFAGCDFKSRTDSITLPPMIVVSRQIGFSSVRHAVEREMNSDTSVFA